LGLLLNKIRHVLDDVANARRSGNLVLAPHIGLTVANAPRSTQASDGGTTVFKLAGQPLMCGPRPTSRKHAELGLCYSADAAQPVLYCSDRVPPGSFARGLHRRSGFNIPIGGSPAAPCLPTTADTPLPLSSWLLRMGVMDAPRSNDRSLDGALAFLLRGMVDRRRMDWRRRTP
jgi:hypothetical protein